MEKGINTWEFYFHSTPKIARRDTPQIKNEQPKPRKYSQERRRSNGLSDSDLNQYQVIDYN